MESGNPNDVWAHVHRDGAQAGIGRGESWAAECTRRCKWKELLWGELSGWEMNGVGYQDAISCWHQQARRQHQGWSAHRTMVRDRRGSGVLSRLAQELAASTHHLLPGANRAGPGWQCAEAALGTRLDHHPIVWLRVNKSQHHTRT